MWTTRVSLHDVIEAPAARGVDDRMRHSYARISQSRNERPQCGVHRRHGARTPRHPKPAERVDVPPGHGIGHAGAVRQAASRCATVRGARVDTTLQLVVGRGEDTAHATSRRTRPEVELIPYGLAHHAACDGEQCRAAARPYVRTGCRELRMLVAVGLGVAGTSVARSDAVCHAAQRARAE